MEHTLIKTPSPPEKIGLTELFDSFIRYLDVSEKTLRTYSCSIRQFLKYAAENGITQPTREDILTYREHLKNNYKPATVQLYIMSLKIFFQWTEQEGLYPDIAKRVKGVKINNKMYKKDYLTSKQVKNVLNHMERETVKGRRNYAIFSLMVTGGLRDIEVHRANIEDLRTLGDDTVLYLQGKWREDRADYVKIPPEVEKAIRASLADRKDLDGKQPLFISISNNTYGKRLSTRSISAAIKKALVQAGYDSDRLTAHSLRHTAVTLSLLGGNSLQAVQQFARHTNINTTLIYAHNLDRTCNQCENTIASLIF